MYLSVSMCVQVFRNLKLIRFYIAAFIMTTLSHPFKDEIELPDLSEDEQKLVDELFAWYIRLCSKLTINLYTLRFTHTHRYLEQPQFPSFTRTHARQFLHACLWDLKEAKKSTQKYCHIRATSPELFGNRDPTTVEQQNVFNIT